MQRRDLVFFHLSQSGNMVLVHVRTLWQATLQRKGSMKVETDLPPQVGSRSITAS